MSVSESQDVKKQKAKTKTLIISSIGVFQASGTTGLRKEN
jgi:hypothetical protein